MSLAPEKGVEVISNEIIEKYLKLKGLRKVLKSTRLEFEVDRVNDIFDVGECVGTNSTAHVYYGEGFGRSWWSDELVYVQLL